MDATTTGKITLPLDANLKFEIKAFVFQKMTGMMAPGKDCGHFTFPTPEDRFCEWEYWIRKHGKVVDLMFQGIEYFTREGES